MSKDYTKTISELCDTIQKNNSLSELNDIFTKYIELFFVSEQLIHVHKLHYQRILWEHIHTEKVSLLEYSMLSYKMPIWYRDLNYCLENFWNKKALQCIELANNPDELIKIWPLIPNISSTIKLWNKRMLALTKLPKN